MSHAAPAVWWQLLHKSENVRQALYINTLSLDHLLALGTS